MIYQDLNLVSVATDLIPVGQVVIDKVATVVIVIIVAVVSFTKTVVLALARLLIIDSLKADIHFNTSAQTSIKI